MTRLIIKPHRPGRMRLLAGALVMGVFVAGWGLFEYGRTRAGFDALAAQQEQERLLRLNTELQQENGSLREEKAMLERNIQIDGQACREQLATVSELHDEIAACKGELAFYQNILSPQEAQQGLRVESFDILPSSQPYGYRYKLVLTQLFKSDRLARGKVSLEFAGRAGGKERVLSLGEVTADKNKAVAFNFKYFQNIEGDVRLPAGFIPQRVVVRVEFSGGSDKTEKLEKSFNWPTGEV